MPVSTLQYYFGSREDLLVAAFRHASVPRSPRCRPSWPRIADPWDQLARIVTRSWTATARRPRKAGRLWIESWRFGIRDAEMRADVLRDYAAWRQLVAGAVRSGVTHGRFATRQPPERIAVLVIALVDGLGIPLALGDPEITPAAAAADVLSALAELLQVAQA